MAITWSRSADTNDGVVVDRRLLDSKLIDLSDPGAAVETAGPEVRVYSQLDQPLTVVVQPGINPAKAKSRQPGTGMGRAGWKPTV